MEAQGWEEAGCLLLTLGEFGEAACICWYSVGGLGWRRPILILGMMEATGCLKRGEVAEGSRGAEGEGKEMKAMWELFGTPPTDLHQSWWLTGPASWLCSHIVVFNLFESQFLHLENGMMRWYLLVR